ncbi:flagellar assembly protein FliW [Fervidicella metallireducens AeB]|uniref:Flagellar assembly factor FliW n=1 Tax=Fervidicella metallireducens AeB TaxID=1403537 RepID=A0A017RVR5_9CLOT|nr:flagellar assembly protein FliW [Fervidicella metallireducens]EYE88777.1 flagellar assembly protein FliW [Fervidicella metallireducens AeB]
MKISTKFFGEIELEDSQIITFKRGIPGFENEKKFVLLDIEDTNFKCIQSINDKDVCLLLISPWDYIKDYEIELSDEEIKELELTSHEQVMVYNVVTIRENKITANFLAPIIINIINNNGKQIILTDSKYSIRQEIKC